MHLFFCVLICAAVTDFPGTASFESAKLGNGQPIPPWSVCKEASGHIKATTKTTITISDWNKPNLLITLPVFGELASGSVDDSVSDCNAYRVMDLKIGDGVTLYTIVENKITYCVSITIRERPDGLIPKSQKPKKLEPHHEVQNDANAYRKAGIPDPRLLRSPPRVISAEENEKLRGLRVPLPVAPAIKK